MLLLLLACTGPDDSKNLTDSGDPATTDSMGGDSGTTGMDPRFQALADAILADIEISNASGASVAVMENGVVTWAAGFGSADPDSEVPVTTDMVFQIGSTTKMMTATALLQQVEAGTISLDDTVETLLPDFEYALDGSWDDAMTVRDLLSHQGGSYDYIRWETTSDDSELATWTYGEYANNIWLMSPSGAFWNYSNPNFVLAGLINQELDGRMWPDIVTDDVLRPLGMDTSFTRKSEVEAYGKYPLSYGYGVSDMSGGLSRIGAVAMEDLPDPAATRPAGLNWATPTDMLAFASFLMHGNSAVLGDTTRAELTTEQVDMLYIPELSHYGFGVMLDRGFFGEAGFYETPLWHHGGNTLSFTSTFYMLPELDFAISILSNGYGDDFGNSVLTAFLTLTELPDPVEGPEIVVDPEGLDAHVGTYMDSYNVGEIIVTREGDTLYIQMPVLDELGYSYEPELLPYTTNVWYVIIDGAYYDLTFIPADGDAESTYIRNRAFVGVRSDEARQAAPEISPERVARWLERQHPDPDRPAWLMGP